MTGKSSVLSIFLTFVVAPAMGFLGYAMMGAAATAATPPPPPAMSLGVWAGSPGNVPAGAHPDVLNDYVYYGSPFPSQFASQAEAKGAVPFVELEPWHGGGTADCSSLHGTDAYYQGIGSAIKAGGKPVVLTWGHEFAVSGQYPWAVGNGCGFTTADWIAGWKQVVTDVRSTAGGLASFMWAPNADTCPGQSCTTHDPSPWWPGPSYVDMTGVDGYPAFCDCGTFAKLFAPTFKIIQALPGFAGIPERKIFVAETDLAPLGSGSYESMDGFIADLCKAGGDGVLQFQDGTPAMSSSQWAQLDAALNAHCRASATTQPTLPAPGSTTAPPTSPATTAPAIPAAQPTAASPGFQAPGAPRITGRFPATVTWAVPPDGSSAVLYYQLVVTRGSTVTVDEQAVVPAARLYLARGQHSLRVRACDAQGCSPWSSPTMITLLHLTRTRSRVDS